MKKLLLFTLVLLTAATGFSQGSGMAGRVTALRNNDKVFYNTDGILITTEHYNTALTEKGLKKPLRQYDLKFADLGTSQGLRIRHYYAATEKPAAGGFAQQSSVYFVENGDLTVTVFWFAAINKRDKDKEHEFIKMVQEKRVPAESFLPMTVADINFGGRKLQLGDPCYWTNINTVQCPYMGEMNWSVHKDKLDAEITVNTQMQMTKAKNNVKVLTEEQVDIIFEEVPTKATKVVYDLTGLASVGAGMSGGKTLTAYYVAEQVRGNYISCVLSHWNNDDIGPSGLPQLLEQVMKLK